MKSSTKQKHIQSHTPTWPRYCSRHAVQSPIVVVYVCLQATPCSPLQQWICCLHSGRSINGVWLLLWFFFNSKRSWCKVKVIIYVFVCGPCSSGLLVAFFLFPTFGRLPEKGLKTRFALIFMRFWSASWINYRLVLAWWCLGWPGLCLTAESGAGHLPHTVDGLVVDTKQGLCWVRIPFRG